ncbi:YqiA/YcfP family alpha/beta fold hydrolase [Pokkaliibacter sp. CJK22405]|uniref:YqiA/YcfP family alpha/beta fold hydrolase n=1 Tax=Pokkaliibacter sp. CJK22405 TaxID=3384615 RepID=UPI003984D5D2
MTPHFIYLHGFNSGPKAAKAAELQAFLASRQLPAAVVPELHHRPAKAIATVSQLIESAVTPPVLVGSSLGGYYATWLAQRYQLKAVLINPAVDAPALMRPRIGIEVVNPYTRDSYILDSQHVEELRAIQLETPPSEHLMVLLQTGDETLDYRKAETYYAGATLVVEEGGNHRFEGFPDHCPAILEFARR